jgi:hypothetical protein
MTTKRSELNSVTSTFDPFDPEKLRLSQDFAESVGVKKLLTTIPVRKPAQQDFVRVHSDPAYRLNVGLIELKEDRETYLVYPTIASQIPGEFYAATLFTTINRQGVLSLWPVKLPPPDGRQIEWHRSAADAAELAMTRWVRVKANMGLGAYQIFEAESSIPDPEWPDHLPFREMLKIAFRDCIIDSLDHPVLKRLRGEQ